MNFKLKSKYKPTGDQPQAIEKLTEGLKKYDLQTLLGVTGSGKTFTVISRKAIFRKPIFMKAVEELCFEKAIELRS